MGRAMLCCALLMSKSLSSVRRVMLAVHASCCVVHAVLCNKPCCAVHRLHPAVQIHDMLCCLATSSLARFSVLVST